VIDEKRADHRILYKIGAFIDEEGHGEAESFNKKQAEQQAAELACKALGI
jgi:dsRNA-specific ribonuclease